VVRHEAAEALGNFNPSEKTTPIIRTFSNSKVEEVRDTCILSLRKHQTYLEKNK